VIQHSRISTLAASSLPSSTVPAKSQLDLMRSWGEMVRLERGDSVCREHDLADHIHCVVSGLVTRYIIRPDGHRQIVDLAMPGDFFGFTHCRQYRFAAEAVIDNTTVMRIARHRIETFAASNADIANGLREASDEALARTEHHLLVMGRITAPEKVGSFLIELIRRLHGHTTDVTIPISRYDIADYLAISVETVSRALTELKQRGFIQLIGPRRIRIVDRSALDGGAEEGVLSPPGEVGASRVARRAASFHLKGITRRRRGRESPVVRAPRPGGHQAAPSSGPDGPRSFAR
jgi:CRP/FNR family nitrogen fixation transcriptional regulator